MHTILEMDQDKGFILLCSKQMEIHIQPPMQSTGVICEPIISDNHTSSISRITLRRMMSSIFRSTWPTCFDLLSGQSFRFRQSKDERANALEVIKDNGFGDVVAERAIPVGIAAKACYAADASQMEIAITIPLQIAG